jgi:sugar O-acyltransferase (sialic acid O-acetyltransferase NeuD family)
MKTQTIAIYGAGGFAREVAWLAESCSGAEVHYEPVCFIDDDENRWGKLLNGLPVVGLHEAAERFGDAKVVLAVGNPKAREALAAKAACAGFAFAPLIHPGVERSRWIEYGEGAVICAGSILTTNIRLGCHVQINLDCTIGHDVVLGDYTTLAPGVHVSGWVHFGRRVYVGTGAVLVNGTEENPLTIGDDVVIGAGACVTKSIESGTWGGVPARDLHAARNRS